MATDNQLFGASKTAAVNANRDNKKKKNEKIELKVSIPGATGTTQDGSFSQLLYATLVQIGGWDKDAVLIEKLPLDLYDRLGDLARGFEEDNEEASALLSEYLKSIVGTAEGANGAEMNTDADLSGIDGDLPDIVFQVGVKMNAPDKALLAAMITGFVETGWTNPKTASADGYGSYGWRQERASLYGGSDATQNVKASAKRFFNEVAVFMKGSTPAKGAGDPYAGKKYQPSWHAGLVAQAVQGSAANVAYKYQDKNGEYYKKGEALFNKLKKKYVGSAGTSKGLIVAPDADKVKAGSVGGSSPSSESVSSDMLEKLTKPIDLKGSAIGFTPFANWAKSIGLYLSSGKRPGSITVSGNASEHQTGHAADFALAGVQTPEEKKDKFYKLIIDHLLPITHQVIYKHDIWTDGKKAVWEANDHMNHVHVSLKGKYLTNKSATAQALAQALNGASLDVTDEADDAGSAAGATAGGAEAGAFALAAQLNLPGESNRLEANLLTGDRALMNDTPLFPFIQQLCDASLRSFQSLPDGKFFAFYPDYFGELNHSPAYWEIDDIEILDGKIELSDESLVTHMYVIGANSPSLMGSVEPWFNKLQTWGVVTIFNAFLSESVLNTEEETDDASRKKTKANPGTGPIDPKDAAAKKAAEALDEGPTSIFGKGMLASKAEAGRFLERYGARVEVSDNPFIYNRYFELFTAYQKFLLGWSRQFLTTFTFTFMPELYPGGKVAFPNHGIQMYIDEVTHEFDYEGGFTTSANLSAPSVLMNETGEQRTNLDLPANMAKAIVEPVTK